MHDTLWQAVEAYLDKKRARFHMPGHKGKGDFAPAAFAGILPYDITEVEGVDSLYHASGPIRALERRLASIYGAQDTAVCAGGATLCIQTMLALACKTGRKVIMSRNIHRSAVNTAALLDLEPVWIYPTDDAGAWFLGRYSPQDVREALEKNRDAAAVYITSPDYFGVLSDIAGIAAVCKAFDVPLLVDNAHGAHLKFLPEALHTPHPIDCGAALCADSLHKTLPAMTGAAALHIGTEKYIADAKRIMSLFGSTSPSYPIMLSIEQAACYAEKNAQADFTETACQLTRIAQTAIEKGFSLPQGNCDPLKLSLAFGAFGMTGEQFGKYLRRFDMEPEYISETACVLMAAGLIAPSDMNSLTHAVQAFLPPKHTMPHRTATVLLPRCERVCSVRAAVFALQETIATKDAAGRVAAAEASPCPPGVPIVMSGERISQEAVKYLLDCGVQKLAVVRGNGLEL